MSENWKKAERLVSGILGGRLTPGSGNKGLKGDVYIPGSSRWMVEVKSTESDSMSVHRNWLEKLTLEGGTRELALVVAMGLRLYVYINEETRTGPEPSWKTRVVREPLPETLESSKFVWRLIETDEWRRLVLEDVRGDLR